MSKIVYVPHDLSRQEAYRKAGFWNGDLLIDYLEGWARETPDKVAMHVPGGEALTYAQVLDRARRLANALSAKGLRRGDVVAIQLPSNGDFLVAYFGVLILGGVLCTMHMPYREGEMRPLLRFAKASAVLCGPANDKYDAPATMMRLRDDIDTIEHVIVAADEAPAGCLSMAQMIEGASASPDLDRPKASDPCLLCFTSGTSAAPKGVVRTSETITANARIYSASIELTSDDRVMIAPPFTHVFGLCCVANAIYCGATIILLPLYTPADYARTIAEGRPTVLFTAPAHVAAALKGRLLDGVDLSGLRDVIIAGSVCPPNIARALEDIMPNGRAGGLFGMTECVLVTQTPLDGEAAVRHCSVGRPTAGIEARVVDPLGRIGQAGEEGELQLSGYSIMAGYLDNDAENALAFTEDGFFRTGDLATIDPEGNIFITGRVKDLINRGGIKINPTDIEGVIDLHDKVLQSAVVSAPDEIYGERACVFVVPTGHSPPTLEELTEHLSRNGVAKLRWPERLEIITEMPMTPTRKIMKSVLRSRLALQA